MTNSSDFDWIEAAEDIVVRDQAAIAVYLNLKANVVIRQAAQYHPDEDAFASVASGHAAWLADAIHEAARLAARQPDAQQIGDNQ
jgi:hypothetical protein